MAAGKFEFIVRKVKSLKKNISKITFILCLYELWFKVYYLNVVIVIRTDYHLK